MYFVLSRRPCQLSVRRFRYCPTRKPTKLVVPILPKPPRSHPRQPSADSHPRPRFDYGENNSGGPSNWARYNRLLSNPIGSPARGTELYGSRTHRHCAKSIELLLPTPCLAPTPGAYKLREDARANHGPAGTVQRTTEDPPPVSLWDSR